MGVSIFDFGELFTLSVRPMIAAQAKRGVSFYFDYPAGPTSVQGNAQAFQRSIYRLASAASRTLRSGTLILAADAANSAVDGFVDLQIHAAASGERQSDASIDELLKELHLTKETESEDGSHVVSARGTCPVLGAELRYRCVPSAGILLRFNLRCRGVALDDVRLPNAHGRSALVLHDRGVPVQGLGQRLSRLGWRPSLFDNEHKFRQMLSAEDGNCGLVIVIESERLNLGELTRLSTTLPAPEVGRTCVYAVTAGSTAVGALAPAGWELHTVPFLPSELWDFTQRADPDGDDAYEHSRPTPLPASRRPRVLVVDDDEVNRVIASGLLQMIGYEALSAASGDEAIAMCQQGAPDAVLMDINMPGLDGYQTTAALKRLQQRGGIPPFPIIAATAAGTPARSLERGLDGHLYKPLLADDLRTQLSRALKGLATGL